MGSVDGFLSYFEVEACKKMQLWRSWAKFIQKRTLTQKRFFKKNLIIFSKYVNWFDNLRIP